MSAEFVIRVENLHISCSEIESESTFGKSLISVAVTKSLTTLRGESDILGKGGSSPETALE